MEEGDEYFYETGAHSRRRSGAVGLSSLSASARIVCNEDGDCWHVHEDYAYPPGAGVVIHPDDSRWAEGEHHAWREHPGRGYCTEAPAAPF